MKKVYLAGVAAMLVLASCNGSGDSDSEETVNSDALNERLTDATDIIEASKSFGMGGAKNGEEYFSGILSGVVEVDVKLREITKLDQIDASEEQINTVLDSTLAKIQRGRKAINLYTNETWPQRAEFHALTEEWYTAVEGLVHNYYRELAEPMSRPDDTWSQEELDFYDEYLVAYDSYLEIDSRWVDYQYTYAAANNFRIEGTIDEESMVEQEMSGME